MKKKLSILVFTLFIISGSVYAQDYPIFVGQKLTDGFDMGVNTDKGKTAWLEDMNGFMKMTYPSGQVWGAVFITKGKPKNPPRPFKNFSGYTKLTVEMKGKKGGENIEIGIKDNTDPDNGQETKKTITLTNDWKVYEFNLSDFKTADLSHLYTVIEFVFGGSNGRTVYFKNVKYKK